MNNKILSKDNILLFLIVRDIYKEMSLKSLTGI